MLDLIDVTMDLVDVIMDHVTMDLIDYGHN